MTSAIEPSRATAMSPRGAQLFTVLLSVLTASCDGGTVTDVEVTSVSVSPASVTMEVTDTVRFTATSRGAGGGAVPGVVVTWSSDDSSVASVTQAGLVTGAGEGTTTVRASAAGVQGAASVTVNRRTVASVVVEPSSLTLVSGDTDTLTAFARAANGDALSERPVSWSSSDTSVVRVDTTGSIFGGAPGNATVSATVEGVVGSASVEVSAPLGVRVGSGYDFGCALVRRKVYCWGGNQRGQLGRSTPDSLGAVGPVSGEQGFEALSVGNENACALRQGVAFCWGSGGLFARQDPVYAPLAVESAVAFDTVSVGGRHACALTGTGEAWCWGQNGVLDGGQLGDGTTTSRSQPTRVLGGLSFTRISAGFSHTCGIAGGVAYCWGDPAWGALGIRPEGASTLEPAPVTLPFQPTEIWAGAVFSCAMPAEGGPQCWGINLKGQLGRGFGTDGLGSHPEPEPLSGSVPLDRLSVSPMNNNGMHACALNPGGVAYCWGGNGHGQIGRTTSWICRALYELPCDGRPWPVDAPFTFESIAAGGYHTCGVTVGGDVYCWGDNRKGQLGAPGGPEAVRVPLPG